MTNQLPPLTPKQQAILKLLYRYRFLNRIQIQTLLRHKDKRRIISWLKDLRDRQYVDWHYNADDFIAKSQPGIYYLSLNGIRYLRDQEYPSQELKKRYKEPERKQAFIDKCLLIADCCIMLRDNSKDGVEYSYILPADYAGLDNEYSFLDELRPQLYFCKRQDGTGTNYYLLESFETTLPRYQLRKRLKDYVDFLDEWNDANKPRPVALFACATIADLLYVKRRVKQYIDDKDIDVQIRVTTLDKIKASGVASTIWEEV